jgi:HK97 gp10 family phage protein
MAGTSRLTFSVRVVSNQLPNYSHNVLANLRKAIDDTADGIRDFATSIAPVDTGSLRESIYVNNGTTSDYILRTTTAESLNRDVVILDEIDPEFVISTNFAQSEDSYTVVVGVAASHGIYQEYGTRFQPPQSFLRPAALAYENTFANDIADAVNR